VSHRKSEQSESHFASLGLNFVNGEGMNRRKMMMLTAAMASTAAAVAGASVQRKDDPLQIFDPMNFGAKGDGKALDSPAINAAIDACSRGGGGAVHLRPGIYRSGTVILKSNVALYFEAGSTLLGSTDLHDYSEVAGISKNGPNPRHLIFAMDAEHVTLAGSGLIDGQGPHFWERSGKVPLPPEDAWVDVASHELKPKEGGRPSPLLEFVNCRWLRIEDVRIENAPGWTLRPYNCDNVTISGIAIKNPVNGPNTDGIDIKCCQNVSVSNCSVETGDDATCLKSETPYGGEPRLSKNIVVTNCRLTTCCNGFKLGTGSEGGFENITFSNSTIYNSDVEFKDRVISGVALEVVDGGWIDGVQVSGIEMQRTRTPIFIRLENRKRVHNYAQHGLRNVNLENIHATEGLLASSITGIDGDEVRDVTLSKIRAENVLPCRPEWVGRTVPEKDNGYPEARMFGMLPASGLYVRHVRGLQINDAVFSATAGEARPTVILDEVSGARITGLESSPISGGMPVVQAIHSSDVQISK
jgi:polygalacturonase